ncbi:GH25 family lysozyme [Microcoleus sp. BR0-C5]|uniref:GH25 family lysozyme n=1 Tax=Microcoleus sp. BR0-C5 TaxID=2818713 RepID=UPI004040BB7B
MFSNTYSNNNWLGKPTSDLIERGGVKIQYFEKGHIIWNGVNFEAYKQGNGTGSNSVSLPPGSQGIDVSGWQGNVNWQSVKNDGYSFAFVKATEGTGFTDQQFAQNWQGTKNAGVVRGAYHYFHPDLDPVAQANHFINTIGTLAPNDLPPVLDLEHADNLSATTVLSKAQQWLDVVENATGRKPIVYTYPSFWKDNLGNTQQFSDYPLWIANYTSASGPIVPGGWKNWTFWQYSDSGRVNGISGNVDLNKFSSNASSGLGNPVPKSQDEFFPIGTLGELWGAGNSVSSTNRNDYYSFNIDKRSNLQAFFTGIDTKARLSILAEGGRLLNDIETSSGSASWILEPGNYQIKVEDTSGDTDYNFNLHRVNLVGDIENKGLNGWGWNDEDRTHKDGANLYRYHINQQNILERTYQGIEPGKDTIIVIHGWTDSSNGTNIQNLLAQVANKYTDYQVLALDWTDPAKDAPNPGSSNQDYKNGRDQQPGVPWHAARSIAPVAQWAKNTLENLGIGAEKISLFGHSLGSYVSAEIGHLFGKVKNLVAIDPAYPGHQYDIDGNKEGDQRITEFKDAAEHSLAFVVKEDGGGGIAGDGHTADTANNSLVISYEGWANPIDAASPHNTAVDVVADALSQPDRRLKLENNLALPSDLWKDKYGDSGNYIRWSGTHEGRVTATRNGKIKELAYINGSSWGIDQETTTWT